MQKVWQLCAVLCLATLALGGPRADDFDGKVPEPPDIFTGTAPVDNGSLVPLKDGRLMMVGSGTRVSYSKDGGRTWTPSQPLAVKGKPLSGGSDPTSLIRLKSGKLALLYGREAHAVGAPPGHDLFFRTSADEGGTWSEEKQINVPGVTASPYHDVLTQLESGRLVLPVRWLLSGRFPEMKNAGAFGAFQGKRFQVEGHAHWPEMDTTFGVREGLRVNGDRVEMMPGQRKLLIRPIKWLYEE